MGEKKKKTSFPSGMCLPHQGRSPCKTDPESFRGAFPACLEKGRAQFREEMPGILFGVTKHGVKITNCLWLLSGQQTQTVSRVVNPENGLVDLSQEKGNWGKYFLMFACGQGGFLFFVVVFY